MLVLGGLLDLHRTDQLHLLWHQWLGHRIGLQYAEWFTLETANSVIFEIAPKYCISDSLLTLSFNCYTIDVEVGKEYNSDIVLLLF